ncbi:MAG: aldehyde dehydrogenase family protein [Mesorhizobium sp.]|uniref:aldehyde dehydrogenase family protein n=1 Tax=Mesorhizobium sp. TaxID=1871066 RepID=UPI001AC9C2FC|nr:aldehyde dehydrogenase family protein [Mesorhizobium sp.]MBN9219227.1 aldehyde dehydrogenase family protein [Mesorhizobium sp.]
MKTYAYANSLLHINGRWRGGQLPDVPVLDPATEASIGTVATAGVQDLDEATACAERTFWTWRRMRAAERGRILMRAADLLRKRVEPIAHLLTMEQGKPLAEARAEAAAAAALLDWFANEGASHGGGTVSAEARQAAPDEPIGPVAAFAAWSFPLGQAARKVAAALADGSSIVLAGPPSAPASCAALVVALADAGLPAGVLNLVYGPQADIAPYLIAHPAIARGSYSGPALLGARLAALAKTRGKRLAIELSGPAPAIVFSDADLELAVAALCRAKFRNAGQARFAPTCIFTESSIHARFLDDFIEATRRITIGNGLQQGVEMGPLANGCRTAKMEALVADAVAGSATLAAGGHRMGNLGCFFWPTVLTDVAADALLMNTEPFGPITVVNRFDRYEDGIAGLNGLRPVLALHAFTTSRKRMDRLNRDFASDMLFLNQRDGRVLTQPYGDIGGGHGDDSLEGYVQARLIGQSA